MKARITTPTGTITLPREQRGAYVGEYMGFGILIMWDRTRAGWTWTWGGETSTETYASKNEACAGLEAYMGEDHSHDDVMEQEVDFTDEQTNA